MSTMTFTHPFTPEDTATLERLASTYLVRSVREFEYSLDLDKAWQAFYIQSVFGELDCKTWEDLPPFPAVFHDFLRWGVTGDECAKCGYSWVVAGDPDPSPCGGAIAWSRTCLTCGATEAGI